MSRTAIAAINRQFEEAAPKGDLDRLASLYTADAMAFPPDGPIVKGRENIKQMWGSVAKQMGAGRPAGDAGPRAAWRHRV